MATAKRPSVQLRTPAEAGHILRCSDDHIYRLIAAGELPAVDISQPGSRQSKTRIPDDGIAAYIARRTSNAKRLRVTA